MKVLVCGATGFVGSAVVSALRSRGHQVVGGSRSSFSGSLGPVDFAQPTAPAQWAQRLQDGGIEAVVNCVGILRAAATQSFERVHEHGPQELFAGAALAGVQRVVQISAWGAAQGTSPYLASKRAADEALLATNLPGAVLRPTLVYGPGSAATRLFANLAALPIIGLPGRGDQRLQPLHVYELAEMVARVLEAQTPITGVLDVAGSQVLSYREMLATYRQAMHLGRALWLPLPLVLMRVSARWAEALPQQVFCRETLHMLQKGSVPSHNAAASLLKRKPSTLAEGLRVSPPEPALSLRAELSPALCTAVRAVVFVAMLSLLGIVVAAAVSEPLAIWPIWPIWPIWAMAALTALLGLVLLGLAGVGNLAKRANPEAKPPPVAKTGWFRRQRPSLHPAQSAR
jgi:uncharacterized protein YbjT (DUF2867 family)